MELNKEYIKLYRSLLNWEWFTDGNVLRLWIYILLKANWKDGKFKGEEIHRGEFVTTYAQMSRDTGLSVQEIRTALAKLISTGEIVKRATNNQQTISVEKYTLAQDTVVSSNKRSTNEQEKEKKEPKKRIKKEKEVKNKEYVSNINTSLYVGKNPPTVDEVKVYIVEKGYHFSAEDFVAYYESNGWRVGKNPMKNWKAACRTWESNYKKQPPNKGISWTEVAKDIEGKLGL